MLRMAQIDGIAATRKNFYATIQDPKNKKIDECVGKLCLFSIRVLANLCFQLELHIGHVYNSPELLPNAF